MHTLHVLSIQLSTVYSELMVYIYMKIQKYSQYMSTAMILCNAYIRILYSHIICTSMFGKLLQSLHTAEETLEYNLVAIIYSTCPRHATEGPGMLHACTALRFVNRT